MFGEYKKHIFITLGIVTLIVLDQLSKWAVTELMIAPVLGVISHDLWSWMLNAPEQLSYVSIEITSFFNIVMVWNYGVSFGLFNDGSEGNALILSAIALAISVVFAAWAYRSESPAQMAGLSMIIGGAIGNVIDRMRFDAVIDFLDFHAFGYHWPSFNIADSGIVIGVTIVIIHGLFFDRDEKPLPKHNKTS